MAEIFNLFLVIESFDPPCTVTEMSRFMLICVKLKFYLLLDFIKFQTCLKNQGLKKDFRLLSSLQVTTKNFF